MKIYTKTGDNGTTRLVDGSCVEKFNPRVEAYGCVDELNSALGVIRSALVEKNGSWQPALEKSLPNSLPFFDESLKQIQNHLFNAGSLLAAEKKETFINLPQITEAHISRLESWIDLATAELPQLTQFILPGGSMIASHLHVARTSCRRAERRAAEIHAEQDHYQHVLIYLNRLSDLLFTWARWVNFKLSVAETPWKKDD